MKKLLCLLVSLSLLLCGCGDQEPSTKSLARPAGCTLPGPVQPVILVHGEPFYWDGVATVIPNGYGGIVYVGTEFTRLPPGYSELGELEPVFLDEPTEDLQMMAGFEATGTVYASEEYPDTIYICMTTGWFEDTYIRFVRDTVEEEPEE